MSIIPKSKFGDCVECGSIDTNCVKVGKHLYCIDCRNNSKRKEQIERSEIRDKKRVMGSHKESFIDTSSLKDDLDFVFSRYIRIREADINGIVSCYTCDNKFHWKEIQAGHFIKRSDTLLRWDTRNVKPQCVKCNCELHGNIDEYSNRLKSIDIDLPEILKQESREVNKFTRDELKQLLIDIRSKLKFTEFKFNSKAPDSKPQI